MKNVLLIAPLAIELDALTTSFRNQGWDSRVERVGKMEVTCFPDKGLTCALGGHGKSQFGIQTQYLLNHLKDVDAVLCAGAAGRLISTVAKQDVVIAQKIIEHDYRLRFIQKPLPAFAADLDLVNLFGHGRFSNFTVHTGAIASGDEDIMDAARVAELRTQTNAVAVAWEGAGGARSCRFSGVPFVEIRGITDLCDHATAEDFAVHLKMTMENVAAVIGSGLDRLNEL